jgi:Cytochrome P460
MVKDSKKYAATGGWGYSSFDKDGKPTDEAVMNQCFPCHQAIKDRDFVFSRYTLMTLASFSGEGYQVP